MSRNLSTTANSITLVIGQDGTIRHLLDEDRQEFYEKLGPVVWAYRNSVVDMLHDLPEDAQAAARQKCPDAGPLSWWVLLKLPAEDPLLGPFGSRKEALAAEVAWLKEHHIPEKADGEKHENADSR